MEFVSPAVYRKHNADALRKGPDADSGYGVNLSWAQGTTNLKALLAFEIGMLYKIMVQQEF